MNDILENYSKFLLNKRVQILKEPFSLTSEELNGITILCYIGPEGKDYSYPIIISQFWAGLIMLCTLFAVISIK